MKNYSGIYVCVLLTLFCIASCQDDRNKCNVPLGMADGKIPDSAIAVSMNSIGHKARLNGDGAWCFKGSMVEDGHTVILTVDLGKEKWVTAIQTQGPPPTMKNRDYNYFILFYIDYTTDDSPDSQWTTCCDGKNISFPSEDTYKTSEVVNLHSFGLLVRARKIRLRFKTSVKSPGDDELCFRIEILGCQEDLLPKTNLVLKPLPSGWLEATWIKGEVIMPNISLSGNSYSIPVPFYYARLQWAERSGSQTFENSTLTTVKVLRLMVPGPTLDATYTLTLICPHQGQNISCGSKTIVATVDGCNPALTPCNEHNSVVFRRPQNIKAWVIRPTYSEDEIVDIYLSWNSDGPGWVTTSTKIVVLDENQNIILEKLIHDKGHHMMIDSLKGSLFSLTFTPQVSSLSYSPSFDYDLYIIAWSSLVASSEREGWSSLLSDLTLEAYIDWEGKMVVTWQPALVREGDLVNNTDENGVTRLVIDEENEFTGRADLYNVTIMETEDYTSTKSATIPGKEDLVTEFLLLKLETEYQVNISCDYGGIVVQCGSILVYTALPTKLTEMDSNLFVYVGRSGGEGWYSQEAKCKKGSGTLVSFGKKEEELLLKPALTGRYNNFWIGLNMCRQKKGSVWSDGSQWIYNLFPQVNVGLSGGTCCVKAEYSETKKSFVWLGETCDALLQAVCEYKPKGLVGDVMNVTRTEASTTTAGIKWVHIPKYWTLTSFTGTVCPKVDLRTLKTVDRSCSVITISPSEREFEFSDLSVFTEFNVSLCAALSGLGFNGVNHSVLVRTKPTSAVFLDVRGDGFVNIMWAQKVAEFNEDEVIQMTLSEDDKEPKTEKYSAKNITFGDLQVGIKYEVKLKEVDHKRSTAPREETREFYAYPPCDCTYCQHGSRCIKPSDKQVSSDKAEQECNNQMSDLTIAITKTRLDILLLQADKVYDDLWVSSSSVIGNGFVAVLPSQVLRSSNTTSTSSTTTTTTPAPRAKCLLLSRSQKAVIEPSDCSETHYAACDQKAPMTRVFPPDYDLITRIGGTWISLYWDSISGWKVNNYTVYYQKNSIKRRAKRAVMSQTFSEPPFVLTKLEKNTAYSIELEADHGNGFMSQSQEIVRMTSDSDSRPSGLQPLSRSLPDENSPNWMSAGWSPSPQFYLAHLICGALVILACISTMLLFFATGMFYQDCVAQLGFLFCVLMAYLLLLVAHPHYVEQLETGCVVLSALLHFLFTCAFLFLALEALTMTHLLAERIKSPFENSNWALVLFAILLPLLYVVISAAIIQVGYPNAERDNCWVNIGGPVIIVQSVANGAILLLTIILILATIKSNEDNQPLLKDNEIRGRQSDSYRLRWVILALALELGVVWTSGVTAYHLHSSDAHSIFNTSTLILAITIIFARTWLDDTFRSKIHRLCCGTELTYKRSAALRTISARTRVAPTNMKDQRASSGFSTTTIRATQQSNGAPMYNLPNSPPPDQNSSTVLIKRIYKFDDEM